MTLREKLLEIMEKTGVTQYRISMEGMISPSILHRSFKEGKPFSDSALKAIAKVSALGVSYDQLVRWKLQDEYPENWQNILQSNEEASQIPHTAVPIIGFVSAGELTLTEQSEYSEVAHWFGSPAPPAGCVAMAVTGDSMAPNIPEGSVLFVLPVLSVEKRGHYVVETVDHEVTYKLVEIYENQLKLIPLNPEYPVCFLAKSQVFRLWRVLKCEINLM